MERMREQCVCWGPPSSHSKVHLLHFSFINTELNENITIFTMSVICLRKNLRSVKEKKGTQPGSSQRMVTRRPLVCQEVYPQVAKGKFRTVPSPTLTATPTSCLKQPTKIQVAVSSTSHLLGPCRVARQLNWNWIGIYVVWLLRLAYSETGGIHPRQHRPPHRDPIYFPTNYCKRTERSA